MYHYHRISALPNEGVEDIAAIPAKPESLRVAYKQAIRSMDANAHIAAAAMFRRALQVITREVLGAKPGNLGVELNEVAGMTYNGVVISKNFSENAYIIKESGNQGSHPDADPDLLEFSEDDARNLHDIFMELITELFVIPEAMKKTRLDFKQKRKIQSK